MLARLDELTAEAAALKEKAYRDWIEQGEKEGILLEENDRIVFLPPYRSEVSKEYERKCRRCGNAHCFLAELENVKKIYLKLAEPEE